MLVKHLTTLVSGDHITQHSEGLATPPDFSSEKVTRLGSVAGPRLVDRQRPDEILHVYNARKKAKLIDAMDWLFNQGIVFDILPDDRTVMEVAKSKTKIQTLACLTYLEREPEQENISLWNVTIPVLTAAGGFAVATLLDPPLAVPLGALGLITLLIFIFLTSRKNYHSKHIAAWSHSWLTAIKEYSPSDPTAKESQPGTHENGISSEPQDRPKQKKRTSGRSLLLNGSLQRVVDRFVRDMKR